jgi:hypothetical protein
MAVRTEDDAVKFVNDVGFCFAFKSENSELPCLWHAACGQRAPLLPQRKQKDPFLSFVWKMKRVLPAEGKVFYAKAVKRRPTLISREFFPYFYALSERTGSKDDYLHEHRQGRLSPTAKIIMDSLRASSPQLTRELRLATGLDGRRSQRDFEKAMTELQARFYIVKVAEYYDPFSFEWNMIDRAYPREVRKARRIPPQQARKKLLEKYFENQLVGSVQSIRSLFGWKRQAVYEVLGQLMMDGFIMSGVKVDGKDSKYYALVT